MTPLPLAELPDVTPYLITGAIILALVVFVGFGVSLRFAQGVRKDVVAELKRELSIQREAAPVAVQQPLIVKPHEGYTPLEKHDALVKRVDGIEDTFSERVAAVSRAASDGREKIYGQLNTQRELLARNTEKTDLTFARVESLDGKIDRILERMPRTQS